MTTQSPSGIPPAEARKMKREGIIISVSLFLIVVLTITEIRLSTMGADVSLGTNIFIFGLINVISLLIILLIYLVCRNIAKLMMERRQSIIGARLRTKLVLAFVGLSLVPTMMLFAISSSYITYSLRSWFNKQIETALDESMEVASTYYKTSAANAFYYGRQISNFIRDGKLLNDENLPRLKSLIKQKQKEYNLGVVEVYSSQREELVRAANPEVPLGDFTNPSSEDIDTGLNGKEVSRINSVGKADLIRGIVPIYSTFNPTDVVGVVVVNYHVPYSLVSKMKEIYSSYHLFRQMRMLKTPIKTGYLLTLFLVTMVIVFLAVWFGLYLAKSLTTPIQKLAEATRQVAEGNLDVHLGESGTDEIGMLVTSFNTMTEDLRNHQKALHVSNAELIHSNQMLEERRRYMETVLKNVTAGVISVSSRGILTSVNTSAERLLNITATEVIGKNFRDVLRPAHLDIVKTMLRDLVLSKQDSSRKQVTLRLKDTDINLLVNLTVLRDEQNDFMGTVVVFDDLTHLIKAQRMAAWREVARRIAHEIKNPLTPIQLSAQRLRRRYLPILGENEKIFDECTNMIVKSVDEMKTLVNEFSNFARMPAARPSPNDLNDIIRESMTLFQEAHRQIQFSFVADPGIPILQLDHDQIKRVIINLLDNAVDAISESGTIEVSTKLNRELRMVIITVADSGHGIAPEDRDRLFEPYFSKKKTGTGLGLAIANSIITDHHGFIRVKDNEPRGSRFIIELPVVENTV